MSEVLTEEVLTPEQRDETLNILTHGLGFALSIPAAIGIVAVAMQRGDWWRTAGCAAFGVCLVAVYCMSLLSHVYALCERRRPVFRALDQGCIFLLIVATYTPFSLAHLRTPGWWIFLTALWLLAWSGFFAKVFLGHRIESVTLWIYVALGWAPIVAAPALVGVIPTAALGWMLVGGLFYTSGTLFLYLDRHAHWMHAIWHLFVIAGSACHYYAILRYLT